MKIILSAEMVIDVEIRKLYLKNFRNYREEEIEFSKNVSIIFGENAQENQYSRGPYLFATGKSHRTNNMNELIRYGKEFLKFHWILKITIIYRQFKLDMKKVNGKSLESMK